MADIVFPGETPAADLGITKLPENVNLTIWRGDAQQYVIKLTQQDGTPISLAGTTAQAMIRADYTAATQYPFVCTIQNGNEVALYLSSTTSKSIPAGSYIWNFQITTTSTGDVRTYLAGDCNVYNEVDGT